MHLCSPIRHYLFDLNFVFDFVPNKQFCINDNNNNKQLVWHQHACLYSSKRTKFKKRNEYSEELMKHGQGSERKAMEENNGKQRFRRQTTKNSNQNNKPNQKNKVSLNENATNLKHTRHTPVHARCIYKWFRNE